MAIYTDLIRIVRGNIGDTLLKKSDAFVYSTSAVFTLSEENPNAVLSATINDIALGTGETATLDVTTGKVTIVAAISSGDVVSIQYNYYCQFSDTQILTAIENALTYISIHNIQDFYYNTSTYEITPYPTKKQMNLIALLAAIILRPNYISYKTSTVSVSYPGNKNKEDKIAETIQNYRRNIGVFVA